MDDASAPHVDGTTTSWDALADWWLDAARSADAAITTQLLLELVEGCAADRFVDLGCGDGTALRAVSEALGASAVGVDSSPHLLRRSRAVGAVVRAMLPDLSWARDHSFDLVVAVGVVELVDDVSQLFAEAARVARPGAHLAIVANHPVVTAPDSAPLVTGDGVVVWSWGRYLDAGSWAVPVEPAGRHDGPGGPTVAVHHRPIGELLTAAARAGWSLDLLVERGPAAHSLDVDGTALGHADLPALFGARWTAAGHRHAGRPFRP